jgi:two-component sensor histidine kinase
VSCTAFTERDGLAGNLVYCTFKDSRGLVWLGTEKGLSLFQGDHFEKYVYNSAEPDQSIQKGSIYAISEDKFGNLWLGTYGGGITIFNPFCNQYAHIVLSQICNADFSNFIIFLKNDSVRHCMSVLTDKQVFEIDYLFHRIISPSNAHFYSNTFVDKCWYKGRKFYATFSKGVIIENSTVGLKIISETSKKLQIPNLLGFSSFGDSLFVNSYNGLFLFDNEMLVQQRIILDGKDISNELINSVEKVNDSMYLIITNTYGVLSAQTLGDTIFCKKILTENDEMDDNVYSSMYDKNDRVLYLGTKSAMLVIKFYPQYLSYIPTKSIPEVFFIHQLGHDTLVAGSESGIFYLHNTSIWKVAGSDSVDITDVDRLNKDSIIVAGRNGLNYLIRNRFYPIQVTEGIRENFMPYRIKLIKNNEVLVSAVVGDTLMIWNYRNNSRRYISKGGIPGFIAKIVPQNNLVFLCASGGLGYYDGSKVTSIAALSNKFCTDILFKYGYYFVTTRGNGIFLLNDKFEVLNNFKIEDGLFENDYNSIFCENDYFWIVGRNSICIYKISDRTCEILVSEDDFERNELFYNAQMLLNGTLYLGGTNGIVCLNTGKYHKTAKSYESFIIDESIYRNGKFHFIEKMQKRKLPYNDNNYRAKIVTSSIYKPRQNKFFANVNDEYFYEITGNSKMLLLNNLKPERYSLKISGKNADSVLRTDFTILPPWYQTWAFKLLIIFTVILNVIWIMWLYFNRRIIIQRKEIEKHQELKNERDRISMDLHDDLGSGLSSIKLISELLKRRHTDANTMSDLNEIVIQATTITSSMRELVWSLNSKQDTLQNFIRYIIQYSKNFFQPSEILFQYKNQLGEIDCDLSALKRRNLFLAYKEILNNIVKHSEATQVVVIFNRECDVFELIIRENGIRFDVKSRNGNGLQTIINRLDAINAKFETEFLDDIVFKIIFPVG